MAFDDGDYWKHFGRDHNNPEAWEEMIRDCAAENERLVQSLKEQLEKAEAERRRYKVMLIKHGYEKRKRNRKPKKRVKLPQPQFYDKVFFEGVKWLNTLW